MFEVPYFPEVGGILCGAIVLCRVEQQLCMYLSVGGSMVAELYLGCGGHSSLQ